MGDYRIFSAAVYSVQDGLVRSSSRQKLMQAEDNFLQRNGLQIGFEATCGALGHLWCRLMVHSLFRLCLTTRLLYSQLLWLNSCYLHLSFGVLGSPSFTLMAFRRFKMVVSLKHSFVGQTSLSQQQHWSLRSSRNGPTGARCSSAPSISNVAPGPSG